MYKVDTLWRDIWKKIHTGAISFLPLLPYMHACVLSLSLFLSSLLEAEWADLWTIISSLSFCLHWLVINFHKWQCAKGQTPSFITDILLLTLLPFWIILPVWCFPGTFHSHILPLFFYIHRFFFYSGTKCSVKGKEISHWALSRKSSWILQMRISVGLVTPFYTEYSKDLPRVILKGTLSDQQLHGIIHITIYH